MAPLICLSLILSRVSARMRERGRARGGVIRIFCQECEPSAIIYNILFTNLRIAKNDPRLTAPRAPERHARRAFGWLLLLFAKGSQFAFRREANSISRQILEDFPPNLSYIFIPYRTLHT
jgi:hypothetical protein